jgi:competence protein ComFC
MRPAARDVLDGVVDLFLPKRCVVCGAAGSWLCRQCGAGLVPLDGPRCGHCGSPSGVAVAECRECRARRLGFVSARAAFSYQGPARRLVTACKFRALRSLAREMADLAAPHFPRALPGACGPAAPQAVTAVPAHRGHRLERGFNQAELLGRELARAADLPFVDLLVRTRHGRRQSELAADERCANVRGAFGAAPVARRVAGELKRVVIVDDVYTTGETLSECSKALVVVGCEPHVFTFARAVRVVPDAAKL